MAVKRYVVIEVETGNAVAQVDNLTGSMDRLEDQSKKTDKELKAVGENGGLIATLDRFTGGLASQMRDLNEATKSFNFSLKGTRTALIGTGIGAVVVAVGLLVEYWDEIGELITGANRRLEDYKALNEQTIGLVEGELGLLEKQIELGNLRGENTEELVKQRTVLLQQQQEILNKQQGILQVQLARLRATEDEVRLTDVLQGAWGFITGGFEGASRVAQDIANERKAEILELEAALTTAQTKAVDLEISLEKIFNPTEEETAQKRDKVQGVGFDARAALEENARRDAEIEEFRQSLLTKVEAEGAKERVAITQDESKKKVLIKEEETAAISTALSGLTALAGEQTAAGKALSVAQAIIDTYAGANKAIGQGGIFGGIAAAGIIAAGLANVRTILNTEVPSVPGGSSTISTPRSEVPQFNLVEGTETNQIVDALDQNGNQVLKSYVVGREVTTQQELDRNLVRNASLG